MEQFDQQLPSARHVGALSVVLALLTAAAAAVLLLVFDVEICVESRTVSASQVEKDEVLEAEEEELQKFLQVCVKLKVSVCISTFNTKFSDRLWSINWRNLVIEVTGFNSTPPSPLPLLLNFLITIIFLLLFIFGVCT